MALYLAFGSVPITAAPPPEWFDLLPGFSPTGQVPPKGTTFASTWASAGTPTRAHGPTTSDACRLGEAHVGEELSARPTSGGPKERHVRVHITRTTPERSTSEGPRGRNRAET